MDPYAPDIWQYALWGLVGAAANIGVVFLEASNRVKGWPWERPSGPGGGVYLASVLVNLAIATGTTAALSTTTIVTHGFIAFGVGAAAPAVVRKVASYAENLILAGKEDEPGDLDVR
ncbi:hypothetical protein [Actinokineospora sp. NBRC 105648]|uniref:hypothetical protein n=1 Tax=Actinokineospora sp. NBRC 105648 TaxID=3032206 RepID=UPI0024A3DB0C|nr:hypothetical protein [Actinokineospora sp. NBRC 105648]GLZ43558.1 hypothetical protein Acsp05_71820 [Actinokineospora sp. NBRC 105648]